MPCRKKPKTLNVAAKQDLSPISPGFYSSVIIYARKAHLNLRRKTSIILLGLFAQMLLSNQAD